MDELIERVNNVADEMRRRNNDNPVDPWLVARELARTEKKFMESAEYWEKKAKEYLSKLSIYEGPHP